jgi:hypothetical protein
MVALKPIFSIIPFDAELAREVRHVHVEVAVDHRQIDESLDAGLTSQIERDECLGEFIGHDRVEQKQCGNSSECAAQRVDVEQVALHPGGLLWQLGFGGVTDEGANIGASLHELLDNFAAHRAGRAGN